MRVILDTNVLIAALIKPGGAPDAIYKAWRAGIFELVTSALQMDELRRVSRYPKLRLLLPAHRVGAMINNMQQTIVLDQLPLVPETLTIHDPNDAYLAAMALMAQPDYLVTGDKRAGLIAHGSIGRTRIVTPTSFCTLTKL
jgi:uncharacterized protein